MLSTLYFKMRFAKPRVTTVLVMLVSLTWIGAATADTHSCVKMVFNRYCLGGEVSAKIRELTPESDASNTDIQQYRFVSQGKNIVLDVQNGRIQQVSRQEPPGGWINFTAWKVKLVRLYGRGQDLSNFPRYATSRSSRLNAINAGRGHAEFHWSRGDYLITLIWDNPDYISLNYKLPGNTDSPPENAEGL